MKSVIAMLFTAALLGLALQYALDADYKRQGRLSECYRLIYASDPLETGASDADAKADFPSCEDLEGTK